MKAHYKPNNRLVFEIEAETQKEIFAGIADLQEIFEADNACGCCNSTNIRFNVRNVKNKKGLEVQYYEYRCQDCNAQLSFGQNLVGGTLYPKRAPGSEETRGWFIYRGGGEQE